VFARITQFFRDPADASVFSSGQYRGMPVEPPIVELTDRQTHDLDVALMWSRASGRVWVNVTDRRSGRRARIDATQANALDVFDHPFAYVRAAA
jgi:hypothetical protein